MVRQTQKVNQLRESKGILGESPLRQQKEKDGRGWFSCIATFFKSLGRPRVDNQVREEIVRDGREIPAKKSNKSTQQQHEQNGKEKHRENSSCPSQKQ